MLNNETKRKLYALKLNGMASAFENQLQSTSVGHLSFEERFGLLVDFEMTDRENRRLKRLLSSANLRETACLEDIDYRASRELDRALIASLGQCEWVRRGLNLIITGPTGSGKTWLGCAFSNQACRLGLSVQFHRVPLLLEDFILSHADGSFRKRLAQLSKVDVLFLDDLGIAALTPVGRSDLLEIIEQRCGKKSTVITSQLPVDKWHDYLSGGNPTVADAIMDRAVNGAHRISLKGESMRHLRIDDESVAT